MLRRTQSSRQSLGLICREENWEGPRRRLFLHINDVFWCILTRFIIRTVLPVTTWSSTCLRLKEQLMNIPSDFGLQHEFQSQFEKLVPGSDFPNFIEMRFSSGHENFMKFSFEIINDSRLL